jgi:acetylornithine deacetylase
VLVYTYDEEVGTIGARRLVETWPDAESLPRAAVIGEPTHLKVARMHKGHLRIRVTVHGVAAHSGYPHLGRNAIEAMARVLVSLRGLRHRLEQAGGPNAEHFPEVPYVPLNVGTIHGGAAVNVVPDRCVIEVGARVLPGMNEKGVVGAVRDAVANAAGDAEWELDVTGESPPLLLSRDAPICGALCGRVGQSDDVSVSFATDGGWFARAGMDCAIFGPGGIEVAHRPNEYVPKADLVAAREHIRAVVERFCA